LDVIAHHLDELFPGMEILEVVPFRVTRNVEVELEDDEAGDSFTHLVELIRDLRKQKGWSAYALAQKVGVSDQAIGNLERSDVTPSFDTVRRLAAVLDFSLDWISSQMLPVDLPEVVPGRPRGRPPKAKAVTPPAADREATAKNRLKNGRGAGPTLTGRDRPPHLRV
jgi:transcriptional regulator with XRE-family HTH domain